MTSTSSSSGGSADEGGGTPIEQVLHALGDLLDTGWDVHATQSQDYDLIASSPDGKLFPIEVKTGSGLLDFSTVVDFGAAIADIVDSHAAFDAEGSEIARGWAVKPVIATMQEVADAAKDYADQLHVELVGPLSADASEGSDQGRDVQSLARGLARSIAELDRLMRPATESGTTTASPESGDWLHYK
jgi:hypothetical protein